VALEQRQESQRPRRQLFPRQAKPVGEVVEEPAYVRASLLAMLATEVPVRAPGGE
jgi:hypothetical protein